VLGRGCCRSDEDLLWSTDVGRQGLPVLLGEAAVGVTKICCDQQMGKVPCPLYLQLQMCDQQMSKTEVGHR
jgi:hypothetical protein